MRIYIAGPMRGVPRFNFPAFDQAADFIRSCGHTAVSPADMDREAGFDETSGVPDAAFIRAAIRRDLVAITRCDAIALLPAWQASLGVNVELALARFLNLPILDAETLESYYEAACVEAARITTRERRDDYGHPLDDFTLIAQLWGPILGAEVTAEKVAMCMVQLKIARELYHPKRDNRVDGAGYFNCLDMLITERERRSKPLEPIAIKLAAKPRARRIRGPRAHRAA